LTEVAQRSETLHMHLVEAPRRTKLSLTFRLHNKLRKRSKYYAEKDCTLHIPSNWKEPRCHAGGKCVGYQRTAIFATYGRGKHASTGNHLIKEAGLKEILANLTYVRHRLKQKERWKKSITSKIKHVLWITPASTFDNSAAQLQSICCHPVRKVLRISAVNNSICGGSSNLKLESFTVSFINTNHLYGAIDEGLAENALSSATFFVQVHKMYVPTLRFFHLCARIAVQTSTPMCKHELRSQTWLAVTRSFPFNLHNLLKGKSGAVLIQLDLDNQSTEKLEQIPMLGKMQKRCRVLFQSWAWFEVANQVQSHTNLAMVKTAVKLAVDDHTSYRPHSEMFAVASDLKKTESLIQICSPAA